MIVQQSPNTSTVSITSDIKIPITNIPLKNSQQQQNQQISSNLSSEIEKIINPIVSLINKPYLSFASYNTFIPGLGLSVDNLYTALTILIPNQPIVNNQNLYISTPSTIEENEQEKEEKVHQQNSIITESTSAPDSFALDSEMLGDGDINDLDKQHNSKYKYDTKNLVKNFLNSFISFIQHPDEEKTIKELLDLENQEQIFELRQQLRGFFKCKKFNRVLLREFIYEDTFRPLFLFYLKKRAPLWIDSGRMKDKESHIRALKNFIFVCENYDSIKSWRFRYNFV